MIKRTYANEVNYDDFCDSVAEAASAVGHRIIALGSTPAQFWMTFHLSFPLTTFGDHLARLALQYA